MRKYFLHYITNSTTNSSTCCNNTHWLEWLHTQELKIFRF